MQSRSLWLVLFLPAIFSALLYPECSQDRGGRSNRLVVSTLTIEGTRTLSSAQLHEITNSIIGSCLGEDPDEVAEHIRDAFQNRGYLHTILSNLQIKVLDPLARPRAVAVRADVDEGSRYTVAGVEFSGNHAFNSSRLEKDFSMRRGDLFDRSRVARGLVSLQRLYAANGYLDWKAIPDTKEAGGRTIFLRISIEEGIQYHMGNLDVLARDELANQIASSWRIAQGEVFDRTYISDFVDEHRAQLPLGFTAADVQLVRDCRDFSVEVILPVDGTDPKAQEIPRDIACESAKHSDR